MRLLTDPLFGRMAIGLLMAVGAFAMGIVLLRLLRRRIVESDALPDDFAQESLYPYTAVIQQLKQQKFVLQNEQKIQQRKAKTAEQITSTVIANLPCGVVFFAANGLVRQANAAARQILGFASPLGMSAEEIFRGTRAIAGTGPSTTVTEVIARALQKKAANTFEAEYRTTGGIDRCIAFTLIPVSAPTGEALGLAAAMIDQSAVEDARRAHVLRSETSAELALELRRSLATIRECAEKMGHSLDRDAVARLATDIAAETENLNQVVGGFLAGRARTEASAAGA